jgi:hypothetical protein
MEEDFAFTGRGTPEVLKTNRVSANFLNILGVTGIAAYMSRSRSLLRLPPCSPFLSRIIPRATHRATPYRSSSDECQSADFGCRVHSMRGVRRSAAAWSTVICGLQARKPLAYRNVPVDPVNARSVFPTLSSRIPARRKTAGMATKRKRTPKSVLKLPDLEQSKSAVLNSLPSISS